MIHSPAQRLRKPLIVAAAAALIGISLTSCTSGAAAPASTTALPQVDTADLLSGVCPATVVIQATWQPEVDQAPFYQLVGPDMTIDTEKKSVTGTLVDEGKDTGVKVEVRSGGPAIGFQAVSAQMYADTSIMLGSVPTEDRVAGAESQPTIGVFATRQISPVMLMWDPATHPDWTSIADIGKSDAAVVVPKGALFAQALVAQGVLKASQIDETYDGTPARFVSDPSIAQDGFVTSERYIYEHEVAQWNKPVDYQLVKDAGYDVYPDSLSIRSGDLETLTPCLTKLVPVLQRALLGYLADPEPTNALLVTLADQYNTGWVYSAGVASAGVEIAKELQLMTGTDPSVAAGGFGDARAESSFALLTDTLGAGGVAIKPGLTVDDVFTNEFIDPTITSK